MEPTTENASAKAEPARPPKQPPAPVIAINYQQSNTLSNKVSVDTPKKQ